MRVRFQADENLDGRGFRRAAPEVDIQTAVNAGLVGLKDPDILRIYADSGRILVNQDRRTMPAHFARYVTGAQSPGVIALREAIPIATAIEELMLIWIASEAEEWVNFWHGFRFENGPRILRRELPAKAWSENTKIWQGPEKPRHNPALDWDLR